MINHHRTTPDPNPADAASHGAPDAARTGCATPTGIDARLADEDVTS